MRNRKHNQEKHNCCLTQFSIYTLILFNIFFVTKLRSEKTSFGKVRVKIGSLNESTLTISPEYEDCKKIALRKEIPIKMVYEEAIKVARNLEQ